MSSSPIPLDSGVANLISQQKNQKIRLLRHSSSKQTTSLSHSTSRLLPSHCSQCLFNVFVPNQPKSSAPSSLQELFCPGGRNGASEISKPVLTVFTNSAVHGREQDREDDSFDLGPLGQTSMNWMSFSPMVREEPLASQRSGVPDIALQVTTRQTTTDESQRCCAGTSSCLRGVCCCGCCSRDKNKNDKSDFDKNEVVNFGLQLETVATDPGPPVGSEIGNPAEYSQGDKTEEKKGEGRCCAFEKVYIDAHEIEVISGHNSDADDVSSTEESQSPDEEDRSVAFTADPYLTEKNQARGQYARRRAHRMRHASGRDHKKT